VPNMGAAFVVKAFVTVVIGGANVVIGVGAGAFMLSLVETALTFRYGPLIGQVGLLIAVIIAIRLMPRGFTGLLRAAR
jgi:branched-subunit amino acid ABC-type transport system permease component